MLTVMTKLLGNGRIKENLENKQVIDSKTLPLIFITLAEVFLSACILIFLLSSGVSTHSLSAVTFQ